MPFAYVMKVKEFADGTYLEYAQGSFDKWCVYMVNPEAGEREPPRDTHYFEFLKTQAAVFGVQKIYADFVSLYEQTGKEVEQGVLSFIDTLSETYGSMSLQFSKIYTTIYMGMIAEERKAGTRLGKRIKRLGVHKLLLEDQDVQSSANFMRGMGWRVIDAMCRERGF